MNGVTTMALRRGSGAAASHAWLFLPNARDVGRLRAALAGPGDPVTAVLPPKVDGEPATITELARRCADRIGANGSDGSPSVLAGYCAAGSLAFEVARLLVDAGATVADVVLADCFFGIRGYPRVRFEELVDVPEGDRPAPLVVDLEAFWQRQADEPWATPAAAFDAGLAIVERWFPELLTHVRPVPERTRAAVVELYGASLQLSTAALFSRPLPVDVPITTLTSWSPLVDQEGLASRWRPLGSSYRHVACEATHEDLVRSREMVSLLAAREGADRR